MSDFLELEGICKDFGSFCALNDVSLSIGKGEFVCFLGPSGCGKTTLLRIIAGLEERTAGTIRQAGRDISSLPPAERDYGIVFQSYALFPNLTIRDNVGYGLVNRRQARAVIAQRVEELLKLVGLPGSGDKYPSQMSGGQQQRVALARALATSPGLLLLDEPLSALDALERVRLRGEIRSLQQRLGVTTIMVTHDQEEALAIADRIVVMNHGVIEQVGTPEQVYREPSSPYVADFVGRVNTLAGSLCGDRRVRIGRCEFEHAGTGGTRGIAGEVARADSAVRVYIRPEDLVLAAGDAAGPNRFEAAIERIEFTGAHCLLRVKADALDAQKLQVLVAHHELEGRSLVAGALVPLTVAPSRVRVFA